MPPAAPTIRQAKPDDTSIVCSILHEVRQWLTDRGIPLWQGDELQPEHIAREVARGMFWLAWAGDQPAGCVRLQLEDPLFWPDVPPGEAAYVHRLAVRRAFAGTGISDALLAWARDHAAAAGRSWLRLDTAADRPALRAVYDRFGFAFHSERRVGPYLVARYHLSTGRSMPIRSAGPVTSDYLRATPVIDWDHPSIYALSRALSSPGDDLRTAANCYAWVRDEVAHSSDFQRNPVTCRASDVLERRTGYCYAKSHLLAALLRASGIPAGFCYQRLSLDGAGPPYCLHGLIAVLLTSHGWYRCDPRGNRPGIDARFSPPVERLAFDIRLPEEAEFENVLADPLPEVVAALEGASDWRVAVASLPDLPRDRWAQRGLVVRNSIHPM